MRPLNRCLCWSALLAATLCCGAQSQDSRSASPAQSPTAAKVSTPAARQPEDKIWVEDAHTLYVRLPDGSARLVARSKEHEGFYDPQLSPNGKWLIVRTLSPNDVEKTKATEDDVLINVNSGARMDSHTAAQKLGLGGKGVSDMEWVRDRPATLRFSVNHEGVESKTELDVPDSFD